MEVKFFVGVDIDIFFVVFRYIDRFDFFGIFYEIFKNNEDVKDLYVCIVYFFYYNEKYGFDCVSL